MIRFKMPFKMFCLMEEKQFSVTVSSQFQRDNNKNIFSLHFISYFIYLFFFSLFFSNEMTCVDIYLETFIFQWHFYNNTISCNTKTIWSKWMSSKPFIFVPVFFLKTIVIVKQCTSGNSGMFKRKKTIEQTFYSILWMRNRLSIN